MKKEYLKFKGCTLMRIPYSTAKTVLKNGMGVFVKVYNGFDKWYHVSNHPEKYQGIVDYDRLAEGFDYIYDRDFVKSNHSNIKYYIPVEYVSRFSGYPIPEGYRNGTYQYYYEYYIDMINR